MADRDSLIARLEPSIAAIDAATWNGLAGTADPFLGHAFLSLLESSGSVGEGTGWGPLAVLVEEEGMITGAAPAYLKTHSQGEYVFDHGWADAWEQAGGAYYPKLQIAIPFTPCPGQRLLGPRRNELLAALETITRQNGLSSAHITFCDEADRDAAVGRGWLERHGLQYHWRNRGYPDFEGFLDALSSRKRKTIRKERAAAVEGLEIVAKRGAEIASGDWDAMWAFYQDTGSRKWGRPYLTRAFFDGLGEALGDRVLLFLANRDGEPVAGALNLIGADTLYGRYWGCREEMPFLHFELSYYQAIDWAIANGLTSVQAGAQGEHKLARGYEPVLTRSVHFLPDPNFRRAVAEFLEREREAVEMELAWAETQLPYKVSGSP